MLIIDIKSATLRARARVCVGWATVRNVGWGWGQLLKN